MIDIDYLCFLRIIDNFKLFELEEISILRNNKDSSGEIIHFDHFQNIESFNLKFEIDGKNNEQKINLNENNKKDELNNEKLKNNHFQKKVIGSEIVIDQNYPELSRNLIFGIPEVFKQSFDENVLKFHYYIIIGSNAAVICVTNSFSENIRKSLVHLVRDFEEIFGKNVILSATKPIYSPKLAQSICEIFYSSIINENLIPTIKFPLNLSNLILDLLPEGLKKLDSKINALNSEKFAHFPDIQFIEASKKIFEIFRFSSIKKQDLVVIQDRINGLSDIESLISRYQLDSIEFKQYLLFLWLGKMITFRIPKYEWDIFERTHKSNPYLYDGSDEQKILIEKHDSGKIISLLSRIDGRCMLSDIRKKMNITDVKFMQYIYELLELGLVKKIPCYPKLKSIPEEKIPLLIIEGLTQGDLDLIDKISPDLNGFTTLMDIALKSDVEPYKMKVIFDKLEKFELIKRNVEF